VTAGAEEGFFTPIRWNDIEQVGDGIYLYRPKSTEFRTPRGVEAYLRQAYPAFRRATTLLAEHERIRATESRVTKYGFLLHPNEGEPLLGLNVKRQLGSREYGIFINPFVSEHLMGDDFLHGPAYGDYSVPSRAALRVVTTMIHELAHLIVPTEGPDIQMLELALERTMDANTLKEARNLIFKMMVRGQATNEFSRRYVRLRDEYLQRVRRSGRSIPASDLLRFAAARPQAAADQ
jgi:hypothetical protein